MGELVLDLTEGSFEILDAGRIRMKLKVKKLDQDGNMQDEDIDGELVRTECFAGDVEYSNAISGKRNGGMVIVKRESIADESVRNWFLEPRHRGPDPPVSPAAPPRGPVPPVGTNRERNLEASANVFRKDSEEWQLAYNNEPPVLLKHLVGLDYIQRLIEAYVSNGLKPKAISCLDLRIPKRPPSTGSCAAREAFSLSDGSHEPTGGETDGLSDRRALADYDRRVREIEEELTEARRNNNQVRKEQLQAELAMILEQIDESKKSPHSRRNKDIELARGAVLQAIKRAIDRVRGKCPALGEHLDKSVRTGNSCHYDPRPPIEWDL